MGMASQRRRSSSTRSRNFSSMNCGEPTGVPRTFKPSGCHASSPNSSMSSGAVTLLFQTLVLPSFCLLPAAQSKDSHNNLNRGTTRCGRQITYTSSKNAHNCSPSSRCAATSSSAPRIAMEKKQGIRGSPCSPPSAWVTVRCLPTSSSQEQLQGESMGRSNERQNCACLRHVKESLEHGRPQHLVASANTVHTENRRSKIGVS